MFSQDSERGGALPTGHREHRWAEGAPGSEATKTTAGEAGALNKTFGCELGTEMPVVKETRWTRLDLTLATRGCSLRLRSLEEKQIGGRSNEVGSEPTVTCGPVSCCGRDAGWLRAFEPSACSPGRRLPNTSSVPRALPSAGIVTRQR